MLIRPLTAHCLGLMFYLAILVPWPARAAPFVVVQNGQAACAVALDLRGSTLSYSDLEAKIKGFCGGGTDAYSLVTWGRCLAERTNAATGADLKVQFDAPDMDRTIVISLAENYPNIAQAAGLNFDTRQADPIAFYDGFCITSSADRLYIVGQTWAAGTEWRRSWSTWDSASTTRLRAGGSRRERKT